MSHVAEKEASMSTESRILMTTQKLLKINSYCITSRVFINIYLENIR